MRRMAKGGSRRSEWVKRDIEGRADWKDAGEGRIEERGMSEGNGGRERRMYGKKKEEGVRVREVGRDGYRTTGGEEIQNKKENDINLETGGET